MRRYKEDSPQNTIHKIRSILNEIDMPVYEVFWGNPYNGIYSVRVESDFEFGMFGQNGKGRTKAYALASAHAELIERLQNGYLAGVTSYNRFHLNNIKKITGIYYYPDEKIITKEEFYNLPKEFLSDIFNKENWNYIDIMFDKLKQNNYDGILSVSFYNVRDKIINYLPFNLLNSFTGSNGMSAGNTPCEGIYQGLCELLERYAVSLIYHEQLTPPTIGENFLKQFVTEYSIIKEIEKSGEYKVIVKDFSANRNIPAIGVLLKSNTDNKYKLNVGCDTSFPIALSRALTEIYQGYKSNEDFKRNLLNIPLETQDYFKNNDTYSNDKRQEQLSKYIVDGSGVFPYSLFQSKPSYIFKESNFIPENSYEKEVTKLVNYFISNGHNVYIRDVSFLGFPSYSIYIPVISGWGKKDKSVLSKTVSMDTYIDSDFVEDLLFPFSDINKEKIAEFVKIIDKNNSLEGATDAKMVDLLKLSFYPTFYWNNVPLSYFMINFHVILGNYERAIEWLNLHMRENNLTEEEYYQDIIKYLNCKANKTDPSKIIGKKLTSKFDRDFSTFTNAFSSIHIPNCPNCNSCRLIDQCLTKHRYNLTLKINTKMQDTRVEQISLSNIFNQK